MPQGAILAEAVKGLTVRAEIAKRANMNRAMA